ncbi:hypothetical protein [Microbulbifer yueqingensis]|uniref:Uncharacterized protein n=1 Tax=Microbulbifer yueqingensis TaxID=658219 RepID=A0A1G9BFL0_9GAMM|nr:hypothetical protein [Microbulbifer yueqingensis]SDK37960.1 hypothetical protein SAMN05216212_2215 [Microbulbifer yueqingensis]
MLPRYKDIVELLKKGSTLEAQEQIMSLREGALELQEENQELKSRIRELEGKLEAIDFWENEKSRYYLVSPWRGPAQAYALKKSESEGEPPHLVCSNCFHQRQKVILNPKNKDGWIYLTCPACKAEITTGLRGVRGPQYAEEYTAEPG